MARRQFSVFSLSFLDVMACGLGAIVLFYMIITAQVATRAAEVSVDLQAETNKLEEQVLDGRKNLIRARNVLESKQQEQVATEGAARRLQEMLKQLLEELATFENDSAASIESIEKLRSDIERLEKAKRQLAAQIFRYGASNRTTDSGLWRGRHPSVFNGNANGRRKSFDSGRYIDQHAGADLRKRGALSKYE